MIRNYKPFILIIFSIAFAYVEASVVVYLRTMYGINNLITDLPTVIDKYTLIELGREASTIIMLASIGLIAGLKKQDKLGYFLLSFGIWDIFYYVWLYLFIGWPKSLFDWDILFLIPFPWWGPVLAPVIFSIIFIITGCTLIYFAEKNKTIKLFTIDIFILSLSILLSLFVFMYDAINALIINHTSIATVKPSYFNWTLFITSISAIIIILLKTFFSNRSGALKLKK